VTSDAGFAFQTVGIVPPSMTCSLPVMADARFDARHYEPTVPPQVTYAITARVRELDGVMTDLDRIAERWYGKGGRKT
jgi:DNA-binding HxlR family transcriptional regulator